MIFKNKKAIFFTLDSILSLIILIMLLIFAYNFSQSNSTTLDTSYALFLAKDISLVLIESDTLRDDLIASSYGPTSEYLNSSTPSQFGSIVKIIPESGASFNITGPSCKLSSKVSYKQSLYADNNYMFEVILC